MRNLSDSSLVERCINGDRAAWDAFIERFSSFIYWAIKKKLSRTNYSYSEQDVEDIFQSVFVLLWEKGKLRQIRDRESIKAWLAIVAANCAHNFFRNKREILLGNDDVIEKLAPADCSMNEFMHQEGLKDAVRDILNSLSAREQTIIKLSYLHDKRHREIAEILNMPENSVSSIIKRAKDKLAKRLEKEDF